MTFLSSVYMYDKTITRFFIPANSHALGMNLAPASWKLQSHANSHLRTKFSRLDEKYKLQPLELKHFHKRCKLTPIWETKTQCNWENKWVSDGTYTKSPICMISDTKSIVNKDLFSKTLPWTGSERCTKRTSELFGTSSDIFGSLQKTSDMFVSSSEILVLSS